jgi:diacylglycerol kinase (ATP)
MKEYQKNVGLRRIAYACVYSFQGVISALRNEAAFRQEALAFLIAIPLVFWIADSLFQGIILLASILFVLVVELLNSAIEAVVDRIGPEHHELSGRAKDMGSAAVLISVTICAALWIGALL